MRRFLQKKCASFGLDRGKLKPAPDCGPSGRKRSLAFALERKETIQIEEKEKLSAIITSSCNSWRGFIFDKQRSVRLGWLPGSFLKFLFFPHVERCSQGRGLGQDRQSANDVRHPEHRHRGRHERHPLAECEAAHDLKYRKTCSHPADALQPVRNGQRLQGPGIDLRYHKQHKAKHNMRPKPNLRIRPLRYDHAREKSEPYGAVKSFPELHRVIFSFP